MNGISTRSRILKWTSAVLIFCFAFAAHPQAQESGQKSPPSPQGTAKKSRQDVKAVLTDETRVSTAKAAESAAQKKSQENQAAEDDELRENSGVTELRPVPPDRQKQRAESKGVNQDEKSRGGLLKNVHGAVSAGSGPGSKVAGASAGASTRSGKTSVYVEGLTNQNHDPSR